MATTGIDYGATVSLSVTALNGLANSQTAGWQSGRVDNRTTKANDYQINFEIDLASTAAANDKAIYVYVIPWLYDGTSWKVGADGGTTTPISGTEGTYSLATTNNATPALTINYVATGQVVNGQINLSSVFGPSMPEGWSLVIINYTGAAINSTGNTIQYKSIKYTVA